MSRIRQRSKKMEALYRKRRPFVAKFLTERPWCQRCSVRRDYKVDNPDGTTSFITEYPYQEFAPSRVIRQPSTEVHEVVSRARGGDILDPDNCRALCHECHIWITTHPAQATEEGWLKSGKKQIPAIRA